MPRKKLPRILFHLICDDIRQEVGGKISYIGVYYGDIMISDIPFVFPKLCFHVIFRDIESEVKIKISLIDPRKNVLANTKIFIKEQIKVKNKEGKKLVLHADLAFGGVKIENEGVYKLIFDFEEYQMKREIKFKVIKAG